MVEGRSREAGNQFVYPSPIVKEKNVPWLRSWGRRRFPIRNTLSLPGRTGAAIVDIEKARSADAHTEKKAADGSRGRRFRA